MQRKDIIVIGTSAGGISALKELVSGLPRDLKAAVFVVLHVAPYSLGILPEILEREGPLPASNAIDWEKVEPGRIYVAPPDRHLQLEDSGHVRVTRGPRENRFRPAVDPLFRSAARAYGPRVIGVILTGWLDDGMAGLWAVKERGGTTVVQHPDDSFAPAMPLNAIRHVEVEHILALKEIGPLLARLTSGEIEGGMMKWGEPPVYARAAASTASS